MRAYKCLLNEKDYMPLYLGNIEVQNLRFFSVEVQQGDSKIGYWHQVLIGLRHTWILNQTDEYLTFMSVDEHIS